MKSKLKREKHFTFYLNTQKHIKSTMNTLVAVLGLIWGKKRLTVANTYMNQRDYLHDCVHLNTAWKSCSSLFSTMPKCFLLNALLKIINYSTLPITISSKYLHFFSFGFLLYLLIVNNHFYTQR